MRLLRCLPLGIAHNVFTASRYQVVIYQFEPLGHGDPWYLKIVVAKTRGAVMSETTRRVVLTGAAGISAATALAACGGDSSDNEGSGSDDTGATATATPSSGPLATVADIPVGSGKVFPRQNVVVTQPTAGEIKAYSATCTHQGCTIGAVEGDRIKCPCHQSQFRVADGSPVGGPATKPLAAVNVKVADGSITLA
jgi:Rieske Fe-S protein